MHILSILLFCFSSNLDTFLIGLACSLEGGWFPTRKNLTLSSVCTAGTALAMLSGRLVGDILSFRTANLIGGFLLILLGAWFTRSGIRSVLAAKRTDSPLPEPDGFSNSPGTSGEADTTAKIKEEQKQIDIDASVLLLAIALSLNNFALGLGAGITGLPILTTSLATFCASFLLLLAGQWTGHTCLARFCGKYTGLLSGMIILILGVYEIFI